MSKLFSYGNKKLPNHTAIFNMSPALECPSDARNMCQLSNSSRCYAMKAERNYPAVLPYRRRQQEFWLNSDYKDFIRKFMLDKGRRKIKYLRMNEAGDFHSQECVDKTIKIAKILKRLGIGTYVYTARIDLDYNNRGPLVINGSNQMIDNRFKIVYSQNELDKHRLAGNPICIQDCRKCNMCTKNLKLNIAVKQH